MPRTVRRRVLDLLSGRGLNRLIRSRFGVEVVRYTDLLGDLARIIGAEASIILDIGANVGQSAATYAATFPRATIWSFEPYPVAYKALLSKRLPRVKAVRAAVGSLPGKATLQVNADSRNNSLLIPTSVGRQIFPTKLRKLDEVVVDVTTLDAWCERESPPYVDFVKIDTQGSEMQVLAGASTLLPRVGAIQAECNFIPQYDGSSTFSEVELQLRAAGFFLYNLYTIYQDPGSGRRVYALGLFLNSRYFSDSGRK